jgi:hypothetical protein
MVNRSGMGAGGPRIALVSSGNLAQPVAGDVINVRLGANITAGGMTVMIDRGMGSVVLTTTLPYTLQAGDIPPVGGNWPIYAVAENLALRSDTTNMLNPLRVPGAPTIGTAVAGNGQAAVLWTAPASNGGSPITGYRVYAYDAGGNQIGPPQTAIVSPWPYAGLTNGSTYTFRVSAVNAIGESPLSAASNAVTPAENYQQYFLVQPGNAAFSPRVALTETRVSTIVRNTSTMTMQAIERVADNSNADQPTGTWTDIPPNSEGVVSSNAQLYVRGRAFSVTSATSGGGTTGTVVTASAHGRSVGDRIRLQNFTPAGWNGVYLIAAVPNATTFTVTLAAATADATAQGTWCGQPTDGVYVYLESPK